MSDRVKNYVAYPFRFKGGVAFYAISSCGCDPTTSINRRGRGHVCTNATTSWVAIIPGTGSDLGLRWVRVRAGAGTWLRNADPGTPIADIEWLMGELCK